MVTTVKTPVVGSYAVPVVAVKFPVPPDLIVIPFAVPDSNMWLPVNVSVFALNSLLISSINSTFAVAILIGF